MNTVITIYEKGTRAAAEMVTCCLDCIDETIYPEIKADRPHIAFIYDSDLKRNLFIFKDVGKIKKNDN